MGKCWFGLVLKVLRERVVVVLCFHLRILLPCFLLNFFLSAFLSRLSPLRLLLHVGPLPFCLFPWAHLSILVVPTCPTMVVFFPSWNYSHWFSSECCLLLASIVKYAKDLNFKASSLLDLVFKLLLSSLLFLVSHLLMSCSSLFPVYGHCMHTCVFTLVSFTLPLFLTVPTFCLLAGFFSFFLYCL